MRVVGRVAMVSASSNFFRKKRSDRREDAGEAGVDGIRVTQGVDKRG